MQFPHKHCQWIITAGILFTGAVVVFDLPHDPKVIAALATALNIMWVWT